ncbi:hypothetical protein SERLADRAFT_414791 [Serpula lacrymans var. lacrymans S7.9]|uniref:Uncharacterized protein n=1 Tax=Serpula lacrymans var. lacrymans (strain S7.9) TaxID=578457 RepID=F8NSN8_SERL9|nr:uncharacterized protein SERLADRAFT_414791 [Serpula lacrymans var. lacrymans S7.9]EGO26962.1 hypothetical protein SERLADRAFT_414791 [Serpula lacrymans var. lacrymans S7.9]
MWAERKITWDPPVTQSQVGSVARKVKPVRELNRATGKTTGSHVAFSDTNWGEATRYYATSIKALKQETMDDIVAKASTYVVGKGRSKQPATSTDGGADPRARLADV